MNKRLIWNFEINNDQPLQLPDTNAVEQAAMRWESRFFWPDNRIIILNGLNEAFLALSHYQIKHRHDTYYVLPDADYNLKRRREALFYKPILKKAPRAVAFGKKIKLETQKTDTQLPGIGGINPNVLIKRIQNQSKEINVEKEILVYRFNTTPQSKLELTRLQISKKTYFSASIKSHSELLVESITQQLLNNQVSCDYITFLKTIMNA